MSTWIQAITGLATSLVTMLTLAGVGKNRVRAWIRSAATDALGDQLERLTRAVEHLETTGSTTSTRLSEHALRLDALARRLDELHHPRRWT